MPKAESPLDRIAHFLFVPVALSAINILWLIQIGRDLFQPRPVYPEAWGLAATVLIPAALLTSAVTLGHLRWTRAYRSTLSLKLRVAYLCAIAPGLAGGIAAILMLKISLF